MKKKVLFVCLGNICRSPMAEAVFRDMVEKAGRSNEFEIDSAATSSWEIGNPVHPGTKDKLKEVGISTKGMTARKLKKEDYDRFDYIVGMEKENIRNILKIVDKANSEKVFRLLDFSDNPRDIADLWYTGDFETTYRDVLEGCTDLLDYISRSGK